MEQPRLIAIGENANVDSLVFKQKTGKTRIRKEFPNTAVIGRKLTKGPQKWTDVGSQVVSDYQAECDQKFVDELRRRYQVVIYSDVLDTVNKH